MRTILILAMVVMSGCNNVAMAYTLDNYANAIFRAEHSKNHPYGILAKYKHTTPRQACKNTVWHSFVKWHRNGQKCPFLLALQRTYCPIGSNTDNGTCKYWAYNVNYYLNKGV